MISGNKKGAPGRYKAFLEDAMERDVENPLEHVYGGMILGGERYIEETLKRLARKEIDNKEDISYRGALGNGLSWIDVEFIIRSSVQISSYIKG